MHWEDAQKQLADLLEPLIEASQKSSTRMVLNMTEVADDYRPQAETMAKDLLHEALANGISSVDTDVALAQLGGGAASDFVFSAHSAVSLIIKVQRNPKLKNEAVFLKSLQPDVPNATAWGSLFPRVLAMRVDGPPYAYAMEYFRPEDGYRDLSKWIFDDKLLPEARIAQANSLLGVVLDRLLSVYSASKDANSRPNIDGDAYLGRIRSRMAEAEDIYDGFKAAVVQADRDLLNGWRWQLDEIAKSQDKAQATMPSFQTAVHGDSHPGNIIVRLVKAGDGDYRPEVRLIDPRGWTLGDYVFDLAKISHFLVLVGPVERWGLGATCGYSIIAKTLHLGPLPTIPSWLTSLEETVRDKAIALGVSMGDSGVEARYCLAMASSFLGSVPVRWRNNQQPLAVLMYADGLRWLDRFRQYLA